MKPISDPKWDPFKITQFTTSFKSCETSALYMKPDDMHFLSLI